MTWSNHRMRRVNLAAATALGLISLAASATNLYWDVDGAGSAATGGAGIWDASTALWRNGSATGTLQAWPNTTPNNPDAAYLGGTAGTVTIAAGTTIYVNNVSLQTAAGYILTGGDGSSVLAFSGTTPKINGTTNAACAFNNLKIDTGPGLLITQNGAGNVFNFNAGAQFTGTGKVTFGTSGYGETMNLNAAEPAFAGGFDIARSVNSYRSSVVNATVADALGRGPVTVGTNGGACILGYTFGAQAVGGAGDGGPAGVTTSGYGTVALSGAWGASKDRFTIAGGTVIRGSSTQLNKLTRVAAFTGYPGATGPEVILQSGAVIVNTDGTGLTGNVLSLGTSHDLLFGTVGTMNAAGFTLTIGGGTPWAGLGKNSDGDYTNTTLQKGTITIDDAGGTLGEITLRSNGVNYNYGGYNQTTAGPDQMNYLNLGSGVDCPTFQLAGGSNKVNARVLGTNMLGVVALNSTAAGTKFSGALSKFIVGGSEQGILVLNQATATGGVPIDVETNGKLYVRNVSGMDSATTVKAGGRLYVESVLSGTGALTVQSGAILILSNVNGLTGTQNGVSVASGVQTGGIVQFDVNDPVGLGNTQPGALLEVQAANYAGKSLGGFVANGQILVHNPEGYYSANGYVSDSGAGGISGTLTITAPSTGAYPGAFDIRENFLAGTTITCGSTDPSFTVRGYAQKSAISLSNATNAMGAIHLAGAGMNGAPVLRFDVPGTINGAAAGSPAPIDFLCADGGMLQMAGGTGTFTIYNPIDVPAGKLGGFNSLLWSAARTLTMAGALTVGNGASFETLNSSYGISDWTNITYNSIAVTGAASTATLKPSLRNTSVGALAVPAGSKVLLGKNGGSTSSLILTGTNPDFHGTLEVPAGLSNLTLSLPNADTLNDGVLVYGGSTLTLVTNAISGTAGFTTNANWTETFAHDYTGPTTVNAGTYTLSGSGRIPDLSAVTVTTGATWNLANLSDTVGSIAGGGVITLGSATLTAGGDNSSTSYTGAMGGTGGLVKQGTGRQILGGANSYSGATRVIGGVLRADDGVGLPTGATKGNLELSGGVWESGIDMARVGGSGNGQMRITGGTSGFGAAAGSVNVAFGTVASPTALVWGTVPFQPADLLLNPVGAAGSLNLRNAIDLNNGASPLTRTVRVDASTATMSGNLTQSGGGAALLSKTGPGTLVLTGTNSYTGGTTLGGGTLGFANGSLGSTGGITFGASSTLRWESGNTQDVSGAGRIQPIGSGVTATFDTGANTVPLAGTLSGQGGIGKAGTGTLVLTGTNSYTGGTTIGGGMLGFANGSLGSTGGITFGTSSTLRWESGNTQDISGAGRIQPIGSGVTATFDTGTNDVPFAGSLSGQGGMIKAGSGRLTLNAAQSYTGGTTLDAGVLEINSTLAGNVTLNSGTLAGTGSIAGSVTATGGMLAAGSSPGVLDIGGNLSLGQLATFAAELGGSTPGDGAGHYDQVNVAGNAVVDGALSLTLLSGYVPSSSDVLYILTRGTGAGTFSGLPEGASLTLGLYAAQITYLANWTGTPAGSSATGGNDIAIYNFVVPEPNVLVLGLLAGGLALRRRRSVRPG